MKRASDQYVETHFPENVSLFNKLQNKIQQNIEMTNPDNFTGHKEAPKFSDDNVEMSEQKKKTVLKWYFKLSNIRYYKKFIMGNGFFYLKFCKGLAKCKISIKDYLLIQILLL